MPFWDRFVLALYFGLTQQLPAGRDAALRIVDRAITRGRLALSGLNDTSLLILLALLAETSPHRLNVQNLVVSRNLHLDSARSIQLLRAASPTRFLEIVEVSRPPGWQLRSLVLDALRAPNQLGLIENLVLYLGRLFLLDPTSTSLLNLAEGLLAEATRRNARIPFGTVEYLGWVYRVVRWRTRDPQQPLPTVFPAGSRPAWFQSLVPDEQWFVTACLRDLPEPSVDLLYLHFYARLSVEQIVAALQLYNTKGAAAAVVRRLEECWDVLL